MRVALYARVSTRRQAEAQTVEQQLERLTGHARQQGWDVPSADIFRDDGYSGASLRRVRASIACATARPPVRSIWS
jgi:site-specific DNA recombinase